MESLRIYMITYNVGAHDPEENLNSLLGFEVKPKKLPDIFVLNLQEVNSGILNRAADILTMSDDPWTDSCKQTLSKEGYILIKSVRLMGIVQSIFVLKKHLTKLRKIDIGYTRTGLGGYWGNKGAVTVRLELYGCSLCFINSHLAAHEGKCDDRIEDYNSIVDAQIFSTDETKQIFFHDYIFWTGDLNFRLQENCTKSEEEIHDDIKKGRLNELLKFEELTNLMKSKIAFHELKEEPITFPPTFKFHEETDEYNTKRLPAWCDRILYKVNETNYEHCKLSAKQLCYKSFSQYKGSDHKPVVGEFDIKVFADYWESDSIVKFDDITSWDKDEDNYAYFSIMDSKSMPDTDEDWIAVFKYDFSSLGDYIIYEYVKEADFIGTFDTEGTPKNGKRYKIKFPEPTACERCCLIYFSYNNDKVTGIMGIGKPFPIINKDA